MPHTRKRELLAEFSKQLKIWPIVSLLGPRQCGKSTFLRELVWQPGGFTYRTLDTLATRQRAQESPELFLRDVTQFPLVIDEAQKAPVLFDEIKAIVDQKRIPGRFVLSGSTQFSKKVGIRESLTGRTATLRMDTLTMAETGEKKPHLASVIHYLEKGGMPGVCFYRESEVRANYWEQWLETLCERDLRSFSGGRLSPDLARRILEQLAQLELPTPAEMSRKLKTDARRIKSHLDALLSLFVVRQVDPSPRSDTNKQIYLPFDAGLANHLGAPLRRRWQTWFLVEWLNQHRSKGKAPPPVYYYVTARKSFIDFETAETLHLFSESATPSRSQVMTINAAKKRFQKELFLVHCATDHPSYKADEAVYSIPWGTLGEIGNLKHR